MKRVAWYAKKNLCFESQRCFDFSEGKFPLWWDQNCRYLVDRMGEIYLVYLNILQKKEDAIVVCQHGVCIFHHLANDEPSYIHYDQIRHVIFPSKSPVSTNLSVEMTSGEVMNIPAYGPEGVSFDIFRFLSYAAHWYQRNGDSLLALLLLPEVHIPHGEKGHNPPTTGATTVLATRPG